jgi:hypothetical protein
VTDTTPLVAGPLYGLRTWVVVGTPGNERLAGPHSGTPWPDGAAWLEATCAVDPAHAAPEHGCVCGLHALHPNLENARQVLSSRREIAGVVECDGAIEVHPDGFRAQRGRPYALVRTPLKNPALFERLAHSYAAMVVTVDGPKDLVDWCHDHRLGLEPAVVDDIVGAEVVREFRRAKTQRKRRVVGGMAAVIVISVLLALLASLALPDPPGPRVLRGRAGEVTVP